MKKISLGFIISLSLFVGINNISVGAQETTFSVDTDSTIVSEDSTEMSQIEENLVEESVELSVEEVSQDRADQSSNLEEVTSSITMKQKAAPAQGPYISDGSYVKIIKKNYEMWQNFSWDKKDTTTNHYEKLYQARGRYEHSNGQTYYSLYNNKGVWQGYVNAKATMKTSIQGPYIADGGYVKIKKPKYNSFENFSWKVRVDGAELADEIYQARGRYEHFNGSTYYSMYDNKGIWQGYINKNAVIRTTVKEGPYISDGRDVKIVKKNYQIWQNFSWKERSNTNKYYGQTLKARGRYYHYNGNRYYSLYDNQGKWVGYLNATATEVLKLKTGGRPTTLDELDKNYKGSIQNVFMGNSGLTFSSDKEIQEYMNNNKIYRGNSFDVKLKGSSEIKESFEYYGNDSKPFFPNELTFDDYGRQYW